MGNDGGTIARGQDLKAIYSTSTPNPEELNAAHRSRLAACSLSALPLREHGKTPPVVGDRHGNLYLKEKLIEHLLRRKSGDAPPAAAAAHIHGLADVVDVALTWENGAAVCPVSGTSADTHATFAYLRSCGTVLSLKAVAAAFGGALDLHGAGARAAHCPQCGARFDLHDVVILYPTDPEHVDFNRRNYRHLETLRLSHSKKKKKPARDKAKPHDKAKKQYKVAKP